MTAFLDGDGDGLGEEIKFESDDMPASYSARRCQVFLNAFMGVFPESKWAAVATETR
jgi:hypothetical protein